MKAKYINEIYNLTTNKSSNRAMSGDELRAVIDDIFSKDMKENIYKAELKENQRAAQSAK